MNPQRPTKGNGNLVGERAVQPPKLRSRPVFAVLGVLLVVVSGLGGWWLVRQASVAVPVVVMRANVERGAVITREVLTTAQLSVDPAVQTIPAAELPGLVGKRAAADLLAGTVVVPAAISDEVLPATGQSIVGLALQPGRAPVAGLSRGALVRVVLVPREQEELSDSPRVVAGQIVEFSVADDGSLRVAVSVRSADAALVAAMSATGRAAIVWDRP